jgi:pyridoxal biosynthesis lyase PdxS
LHGQGVYNIPVDTYIKHAMMAILGEDGVLQKGGYYMDGSIKTDGTALIKMVKSYRNRTNLINEVNRHLANFKSLLRVSSV